MKHNILFTIALSLFVTGCQFNAGKQATDKRDEGIVLEVFPKKKPAILLSSFVDSIAFIPLENNGSRLVADMVKIQAYEGDFYILDKAQNAIFVFDNKGRFQTVLNQQGRVTGFCHPGIVPIL